MPHIEAIIPTHGAGDAFIECITSLLSQSIPLTRIIIINNNVPDGSIEKLKVKYQNQSDHFTVNQTVIDIYSLTENTGVTGGRNAGITKLSATYDYALFVDHDMIAKPTMLAELIATHDRHAQSGIITPKIYYFDQKNIIWAAGTDINLQTGQTIFYGGEDQGQYNEERRVSVAPATFLVTKAALNAVGLFDTRYFATYEDTDFCFTAKQKGFETWYAPKAITYHKIPYDPETSMQRLLDRTYYVARNRYLFLRKFHLMNLVSYLFIPIYLLYYTKLSLQYRRPNAILQYIKGLWHGLTYREK